MSDNTEVIDAPQASLSSEERDELASSIREALEDWAPLSTTRNLLEDGAPWDAGAWLRLCDELGVVALATDPRYGGEGFGAAARGAVLEEMGRLLYGGPYLATSIAAAALELFGDNDACTEWLPQIISGSVIATIATAEHFLDLAAPARETIMRTSSEGHVIVSGRKRAVLAGNAADLFLVTAVDPEGKAALVAVRAGQKGVVITPEPSLDLTKSIATVTFDNAAGQKVTPNQDFDTCWRAVCALAVAALAAEQVGAARSGVAMTIQYARARVQFGREIGSFQAVRHRLADMYAEVEVAVAAAHAASAQTNWFDPDAQVAAYTAGSFCSETFLWVSEETVQLHGGIGFTWEHDAHLFFKRAKWSEMVYGSPARLRAHVLALLTSALPA